MTTNRQLRKIADKLPGNQNHFKNLLKAKSKGEQAINKYIEYCKGKTLFIPTQSFKKGEIHNRTTMPI